jgi:hypothetical protein
LLSSASFLHQRDETSAKFVVILSTNTKKLDRFDIKYIFDRAF